MKTSTFFFLAIICFSAFAQDDEADCFPTLISSELEEIASSIQVPNCNNRKNISAANRGDFSKLCDTCIPEFEKALKRMPEIQSAATPINLQRVLTDELKRSLSGQLLSIVNLRSASPQADFTKAIQSCNFQDFTRKIESKNCGNSQFSDLSNRISEELGHLLASPPVFDERGILNRKNSKACDISDAAILRAKSAILEESLNEDLVKDLTEFNADDPVAFSQAMSRIGEKIKIPLSSALRSHPLFSKMMNPPKNFQNFLKGLQRPIRKEQLQAAMHTDKAANVALVDQIAKNCKDAFDTYEKYACNSDVKSGKIKVHTLRETGVFMNPPEISASPYVDLSQVNELSANQDLVNVCHMRSTDVNALDLEKALEGMNGWMLDEDKSIPYEKYRTDKYENEIGKLRTTLCEIKAGKTTCSQGDYSCKLLQYLNEENKDGTLQSRLAKSSDKNVNSLLRAMIGAPNIGQLSASTRATLINEGILPKNEKGEYVAQPEIPERRPEYLNKLATTATTTATPKAAPSAATTATPAARIPAPASLGPSPTPATSADSRTASTSPTLDQATDSTMEGIDNEILRRLSQNTQGATAARPATREEVRQAVRDVSTGRPLSSTQELAAVDRVMRSYTPTVQPDFPEPFEQKATLTPGDTPKEQWEKEQKLRALSGMAGAKSSTDAPLVPSTVRGPGSDAALNLDDKKLSTVSLNIAEDKVRLNLSDVLNEKILKSDSEGQLLKVFINNKKDFILQVNNVSFKVKYDKVTGTFKLAYSRGSFSEADRLRPQLEKFFARINSSSNADLPFSSR